ncbi:MAG TPA: alpha/beta hydrolase [Bdellovibrionales bacterium]|nr:alpha/beta hydrolase [Bdellovibrionales bacterium]
MYTVDFLIRRFATPTRHPVPERELDVLKTGHRFTIPFGFTELQAWSWGDGPTIVLSHGWSGRGSQFFKFVRPLLDAGFSVVVYDAPAHGESPGEMSNYPEFAKAVREVVERVDAVGVVGHSFGSMAVGLALAQGLRPIPAVLLTMPADPRHYFDLFTQRAGLAPGLKEQMFREIANRLNFDWPNLKASVYAPNIKSPALILQDPAETAVPWDHATTVAQSWPGAKLVPVHGVGHFKILRTPEVIEQTVEFLKSKTQGSGRS